MRDRAERHEVPSSSGSALARMCFTGSFAVSMMREAAMLAPVPRQPALPRNDPTVHLIDRAGEPTIAARDELVASFARRLSS
jgi:hypothetical protein